MKEYDEIIKEVDEFCKGIREKYNLLGGYSSKLEYRNEESKKMHVILSFITEEFYEGKTI